MSLGLPLNDLICAGHLSFNIVTGQVIFLQELKSPKHEAL